ncbi:hypothetical protein CCHR01_05272 [Colletotrichum chrysophilum]|uniref:Uncharacterized protein n=1 Tax=Colletotrichum chrysophilum TaxID=1836956 RepID=A0AAD9EKS3_9PEZI|nr:hypothetical protein CCHR01_05272 [Colletotrichum chrysophilum]
MNNPQKEGTRRGEHEVGTFGVSTYTPCFFFYGKFPPPSIGSGGGRYGYGYLTLLFSWVLAPASHLEGPSHQLQFGSPISSSAVHRQPKTRYNDSQRCSHSQLDTKGSTIRTSHSAGNGLLHGGLSVRRKHPPPNAALHFPNDNPPFFLFPQGPSSRLVNPKKAPPSSSHVFFFFTTPLLHGDSLPHAFFFFTLSKGSLAYHSATISSTHRCEGAIGGAAAGEAARSSGWG